MSTARRATGGGASWRATATWRYRKVDLEDEISGVRYADTLAEIREDFSNDEDAFSFDIEKRARTGEDVWLAYGVLFFGPSGPILKRGASA